MARTLFIPAKSKSNINKEKIQSVSKNLPKNLFISYSIQFKSQAKQIKDILSKNHKITGFKQVLGCSKFKAPKPSQAILLIGSGRFHAINLAVTNSIPVYIINNNSLTKISNKDIKILKKKQKAVYFKYLHADKIGILVSTKSSQSRLKQAINIKKKLNSESNKKSYLFIDDMLSERKFEDFPDIQAWINTACPRLDMDLGIVNVGDLEI